MNKVCSIQDCVKKVRARGWCSGHYQRLLRSGTLEPITRSVCKVDGCVVFAKVKGYCKRHYGISLSGIEPIMNRLCLQCNDPIIYDGTFTKVHPKCLVIRRRNARILKEYGITPKDYYSLLAFQKDRCAICVERVSGFLHVDHSHFSGTVRGLLCGNCNRAIGLLRDDLEILNNARDYITWPPALTKKLNELNTFLVEQPCND